MERERLLRLTGEILIDECFGGVDGMGGGVEFRVDGVGDDAGGEGTVEC
jgi:hypothetical protein